MLLPFSLFLFLFQANPFAACRFAGWHGTKAIVVIKKEFYLTVSVRIHFFSLNNCKKGPRPGKSGWGPFAGYTELCLLVIYGYIYRHIGAEIPDMQRVAVFVHRNICRYLSIRIGSYNLCRIKLFAV